jgi:hypothetical protein
MGYAAERLGDEPPAHRHLPSVVTCKPVGSIAGLNYAAARQLWY